MGIPVRIDRNENELDRSLWEIVRERAFGKT